jgi:hypothetical protein
MEQQKLRWCPQCGQVEVDELGAHPKVIRKGDDRCEVPKEDWKRGNSTECSNFLAGFKQYSQMVTGKTTAPRLGRDVVISFERRPGPWRADDVVGVQHEDGSETILVAEESASEVKFAWPRKSYETIHIDLERIDDHNYRIVLQPQHRE